MRTRKYQPGSDDDPEKKYNERGRQGSRDAQEAYQRGDDAATSSSAY